MVNPLKRAAAAIRRKAGRDERGAEMVALALTFPLVFILFMAAVQLAISALYMTTMTSELEQAAGYVDVGATDLTQEIEDELTLIGVASGVFNTNLEVTSASFTTGDAGTHTNKQLNPYDSNNDYSGSGSWTDQQTISSVRKHYVDTNHNGVYDEGVDPLESTDVYGNFDPAGQTILTSMYLSETVGTLEFSVKFQVPTIIHAFGFDNMTLEKTVKRERVLSKQVEVQAE